MGYAAMAFLALLGFYYLYVWGVIDDAEDDDFSEE